MECIYCKGKCIKAGKQKETKIQRYQCKHCRKYQQKEYVKPRLTAEKYMWIHLLSNEGCGTCSISRLLHIAKSSAQRVIETIKERLAKPVFAKTGFSFELQASVETPSQ